AVAEPVRDQARDLQLTVGEGMGSAISGGTALLMAAQPVLEALPLEPDVPRVSEPRASDHGRGIVLAPERAIDLRGQRVPGPAGGAQQAGASSGITLENRCPGQGLHAKRDARDVVEVLEDRQRLLDEVLG